MKIIGAVVGCLISILMIVASHYVESIQLSITLLLISIPVLFLLKVVIIPFSFRK